MSFTDWPTLLGRLLVPHSGYGRHRDPTARQGLLRFVLHPDWKALWQTGRLDVQADDDIDAILPKLERYRRSHRNPLLDRQEFFSRAQGEHENIDQFVAALVRLHDRCSFDDDEWAAAITVATHSTEVAISVTSAYWTKLFGDSLMITWACSGVC